jgi:DNA-binding ferritin-like protein
MSTREAYWQDASPYPGKTEDDGVLACRDHLAEVLACLRAQSWHYHTAHWQTVGAPAYANHLLYERLYKSVQDEIDTMAEKMVGYFGVTAVDPIDVLTKMARYQGAWKDYANCLIERSRFAERVLQDRLKKSYDEIKAEGRLTLGLDDFLMAVANNHESHTYLLQQLLVDVDKLNESYGAMGQTPYKGMTTPDKTATPHGGWGGEMSPIEKTWGGFSSFRPIRRGENDDEDFDVEDVAQGVDVELEDVSDPDLALEIALGHLASDPTFYRRLAVEPVAPSAEHIFNDNPMKYEVQQFARSEALSNLGNEPGTPPTPVEIKDQPGGKAYSTLNRLVVDSEDPEGKKSDPVDDHPPLSDFKDWTTVREK